MLQQTRRELVGPLPRKMLQLLSNSLPCASFGAKEPEDYVDRPLDFFR